MLEVGWSRDGGWDRWWVEMNLKSHLCNLFTLLPLGKSFSSFFKDLVFLEKMLPIMGKLKTFDNLFFLYKVLDDNFLQMSGGVYWLLYLLTKTFISGSFSFVLVLSLLSSYTGSWWNLLWSDRFVYLLLHFWTIQTKKYKQLYFSWCTGFSLSEHLLLSHSVAPKI